MMKKLPHIIGTALILMASSVNAASVTYYLNQSNIDTVLPDNTNNYLTLLISSLTAGNASFSLSPSYAFVQSSNYGIDSFGFNFSGSNVINSSNISGIPTGWGLSTNKNQDGYGRFEFVLDTTGSGRLPTLNFSISGLGGATADETLGYFALNSTNNAGQGNFYFASHVAGFSAGGQTSAFFAGSTVAPIPEPESYSLMLTGLGLLGFIARRRKQVS